jgi:hypothetical protein
VDDVVLSLDKANGAGIYAAGGGGATQEVMMRDEEDGITVVGGEGCTR